MNSLERLVGILDQFEGENALLNAEELHERLGYTRSTLYRYLKVLTNAGLLSSLHSVGYTLGPRITELDYRIRAGDPLIAASRPLMVDLTRDYQSIALLCRRYRDKVLCVHQEASTEQFISNYERGLARSLFRGAASRVILANLPSQHLRRLYDARPDDFTEAGFGDTLDAVRAHMRRVRGQGYDVSHGQITAGVTGIAAPVLDASRTVVGSLCLVLGEPNAPEARVKPIAERLIDAAGRVGAAISSGG